MADGFDLMAYDVPTLDGMRGMVFMTPTSPPQQAELLRVEANPTNQSLRTITVKVVDGPSAGQEIPYHLVEGQPSIVTVIKFADGSQAPPPIPATPEVPADVAPPEVAVPVPPPSTPVAPPPAPPEALPPAPPPAAALVVPDAPGGPNDVPPVPVAPEPPLAAPAPLETAPPDATAEAVAGFIRKHAQTTDGILTVAGLRQAMKGEGLTCSVDVLKEAVALAGITWHPHKLQVGHLVEPTATGMAEVAEAATDSIAESLDTPTPPTETVAPVPEAQPEAQALKDKVASLTSEPHPDASGQVAMGMGVQPHAAPLLPSMPTDELALALASSIANEVAVLEGADGSRLQVPVAVLTRTDFAGWCHGLVTLVDAGILTVVAVTNVIYGGPACNQPE